MTHDKASLPRARCPPMPWSRPAALAGDGRLCGRGLADERLRHDRPAGLDPQRLQGRAQLLPAAGARGRGMDRGEGCPASRTATCRDWWSVFNDPTLNSLIDTAYDQNLNLRVVGHAGPAGPGAAGDRGGQLLPADPASDGVNTAASASARTRPITRRVRSALQLGPRLARSRPVLPIGNFYSDWSAGFNMSWELDFWGRFRRAIESANANLDSSVENYDDALVTLLADVATNYVQYRVAQQRIKIARDNVRIQEKLVALVEQQFESRHRDQARRGTGCGRSWNRPARPSRPCRSRRVRRTTRSASCWASRRTTWSRSWARGRSWAAEPMPNMPTWVAAGIPADLLRRRPDVRSAERQVAAQSAQIGVAEADLYPTIFINGTLGYEAQNLSKLFESQQLLGDHHAELPVEHLELRPDREQRASPAGQNAGTDRHLSEPGADGGPGSPDGPARLLAVAGTGRGPGPQREGGRGGHEDRA